ncbi:MAG: hypothetical protein ACYDCH_07785 [Gaiellaceae bacterium]
MASLEPGSVVTDRVSKNGATKSTQSQACLLTIASGRELRSAVGLWSRGRVVRRRFLPAIRSKFPGPPQNVRIRPDGRISLR